MTNWKASLSCPDVAWRILETQHWPGVYEERELPLIYLCVHVFSAPVCMHTCNMWRRSQRLTLGIIPQAESILFFELGSLIVLELTMHARLVAQKDLGIHLSLLTNSAHTTTPTFSYGYRDLSSGPHACMTNISLIEPSPLLRMLFWSFWFLHFLSCVCYSLTWGSLSSKRLEGKCQHTLHDEAAVGKRPGK